MPNKIFSSSQRDQIWEKYCGSSYEAKDVFGRFMNKDNFEADHIFPSYRGGSTIVENGIPLAAISNEEKGDSLQGKINGHTFEVEGLFAGGCGRLYVDARRVSLK